ncbi:MAG: hypothetical protein RIS36_294 [Pseudomonadota bacterium]|jgi:hypothetical protein
MEEVVKRHNLESFPPAPGLPPQPEVAEALVVGCLDSGAKWPKASVRENRKQLTVDTRVPCETENALRLYTVNTTGTERSLTSASTEDTSREDT